MVFNSIYSSKYNINLKNILFHVSEGSRDRLEETKNVKGN